MATKLDDILDKVEGISLGSWRYIPSSNASVADGYPDHHYSADLGSLKFEMQPYASSSLCVYDRFVDKGKLLLTVDGNNPRVRGLYTKVETYIKEKQRDASQKYDLKKEESERERQRRGYDGDLDAVLSKLN